MQVHFRGSKIQSVRFSNFARPGVGLGSGFLGSPWLDSSFLGLSGLDVPSWGLRASGVGPSSFPNHFSLPKRSVLRAKGAASGGHGRLASMCTSVSSRSVFPKSGSWSQGFALSSCSRTPPGRFRVRDLAVRFALPRDSRFTTLFKIRVPWKNLRKHGPPTLVPPT